MTSKEKKTKDEIIILMKRKYDEASIENKELKKRVERMEKGNAGSEA